MRYVNYGKQNSLKVVCPPSIGLLPGDYRGDYTQDYEWILWRDKIINASEQQVRWIMHIESAYSEYKRELKEGVKPEDARYILPNAAKTELAVTFNLRQWRHVFKERALNKHAQWEIRGIFSAILVDLKGRFPAIFCDLE
jgi:flavin-dependent thymidylate synthase